jgi:hypothetical protein
MQVMKTLNTMLDFALKKETEANLTMISANEYNKELEEADKEISSGKFFTQQEAFLMSEEWKKLKR